MVKNITLSLTDEELSVIAKFMEENEMNRHAVVKLFLRFMIQGYQKGYIEGLTPEGCIFCARDPEKIKKWLGLKEEEIKKMRIFQDLYGFEIVDDGEEVSL